MSDSKETDVLFLAERGNAIQAYAQLEFGLFQLFARLGDMTDRTAGTIFYRITNTVSRNAILEKLFRNRFGASFNLFRNSLFKALRPIDLERNKIVHWNVFTDLDKDEIGNVIKTSTTLEPPQFWDISEPRQTLTIADLDEFVGKCMFYSQLCVWFVIIEISRATENLNEAALSAWRDTFLKPIIYPPPKDHLLYQMLQELRIPIQSSPA